MYIVFLFFLGFMYLVSNWGMVYFLGVIMCMFLLKEMNFELTEIHMVSSFLGGDLLSMMLVFLSVFLCLLMVGASIKIMVSPSGGVYMMLLMSLCALLVMVFSVVDMLGFYFVFEAVLIPTFLLVLGWGYQPERLSAGLYLMFYTLFASLPLLLLMLILSNETKMSLMIFDEYLMLYDGYFMCLIGFGAFLIKVPMFFVHLWLPKAHVEAPVAGSMILAGVLLKMGGYGLIRFLVLYYNTIIIFKSMVISLSLVGCVVVSVVCMRQIDMKSLIAYSSVVHMGLLLCGIFSDSMVGLCGSVVIMIGHGLCSSGLFYLGNILYSRIGSRSVIINKGMMILFPNLSLIWFFLISSNMAAPTSLNLLGEIELIGSVVGWSKWSMLFLLMTSFLSGVYCVYLYSSINHGRSSNSSSVMSEVYTLEYMIGLTHWIPVNLLFLKSMLFIMN
uniref:NADH-ubiquinone oxidoreductase chain 4 n=1 Tax=Brachycybe lecontii TaxID=1176341 RepID=S4T041_BRALC|nr:NADH dehydrogenase subunit 4 [Brachycybe lecontii]AFR77046.1 NADH dehydrogenase subunit 4 [Brachycybe lecontii]